jgi:hypothetical protein
VVLTVAAMTAAAVVWRLRPGSTPASHSPDADIVLAAGWLAWVLAGYLCVAVAATSLARIAGGLGVGGQSLARIAPARLRRVVDTILTVGVAATLVAGPAVDLASAATPPTASHRTVTGSPLDWPGLAARAPAAPAHHRHHQAAPAGPAAPSVVVVQPGDSLWAIAARQLGPGASGAAITTAWHAWYAANRAVIGPNPSVIHAGQRLVAPAADH